MANRDHTRRLLVKSWRTPQTSFSCRICATENPIDWFRMRLQLTISIYCPHYCFSLYDIIIRYHYMISLYDIIITIYIICKYIYILYIYMLYTHTHIHAAIQYNISYLSPFFKHVHYQCFLMPLNWGPCCIAASS